MATNDGTMKFFAFPREIRDLIYIPLATNEETYFIASTNTVTTRDSFDASKFNLSIIHACKDTQYEMLELMCRNNTFSFSFPGFDTSPNSLYTKLSALMLQVEFYIDFGTFEFQTEHLDPEIQRISNQFCEALRILNSHAMKRKSCRVIIKDMDRFVSPLLRLQIFDSIKTLVGVETMTIAFPTWKQDILELGSSLAPALGPYTIHCVWFYSSVKFHPRTYAAKRMEQVGGGRVS